MSNKMNNYDVPAGTTDLTWLVKLNDSSDNSDKTGVAYSDLTVRYWRQGGTLQTITTSALSALNDAHADGGWKEFDSTNAKGVYRIDLPDAMFASGADFVVLTIQGTGFYSVTHVFSIDGKVDVRAIDGDTTAAGNLKLAYNGTGYVDGTAQGGGSTYIDLATSASSTDDFFNGGLVTIISGTGAGQTRFIADYTGSSRRATVDTPWVTNPDNTSKYIIPSIRLALHENMISDAFAEKLMDIMSRRHTADIEASSFGDTLDAPSLYAAIAQLNHKLAIVTGYLKTYQSDGVTEVLSRAVTSSPSADPITEVG